MTSAYNPATGRLEAIKYQWNDLQPGVIADWTSWTSWNVDAGGVSSIGDTLIDYYTEIFDVGRIADVNPTCFVRATGGDVYIDVYAANSIDSSSRLAGDPVISVTSAGQVLTGVRGRYFQFRVRLIENLAGTDVYIKSIITELKTAIQQEMISGNSSTHGGTQAARIAPLTREYSKITGVVGNAKADTNLRPILTIGNNTSQAVYTVYNISADATTDSSTVVGIQDFTGNQTITESGSVSAVEDEYKYTPSSVRFNTNNGTNAVIDTNDKISFSAPASGNTYTYEMWKKLWQNPGTSAPGLEHSEYFIKIPTSTSEIRMRTNTDGGKVRFDLSTDGGSTWKTGPQGNSNIEWKHVALTGNGSELKVYVDGVRQVFPSDSTISHSGSPSGTVEIGDLGALAGNWWMDDFRVSDTVRYTANFSVPGELVEDSDTMVLINGLEQVTINNVSSTIELADAVVNLLVTGLPKLVSDANNNIVEVNT